MNFVDALRALAADNIVRRRGRVELVLSYRTFPVMTFGLVTTPTVDTPQGLANNWFLQKVPVVLAGLTEPQIPYGFSEEDMAATDWEIAT